MAQEGAAHCRREKAGRRSQSLIVHEDQSTSGTLKCPNCGGDASIGSVRCTWCGSSLATVGCPACFESIFAGMKHCPWCGTEVSRTESEQIAPGDCPCCQLNMVNVRVGNCSLTECKACGGLWVGTNVLKRICADREEQEAVVGRLAPVIDGSRPQSSTSRRVYVACPVCHQLMNRMNFAGCSGVVVDWCKPHGTWFDNCELPRIIRFIQEGGMRKSRAREKYEIEEGLRRLSERERALLHLDRRAQGKPSRFSLDWREDQSSLLDFLSSIWKGLQD